MRHLIAVLKQFLLISDDPAGSTADARLNFYIRVYEAVSRWVYLSTLCMIGLGLGPKGDVKAKVLSGVVAINDIPNAFLQLADTIISNPPGIILAIVTVGWHHGYLRHVKKETGIITSCFEGDQKPQWDQVSGAKFAPFIGAWLFIAFTCLCLLVGHVKWYALVAILLNLGDFAGNEFTKNNLLKYFKKKEFRTRDKTILKRREIALEYWSEKWQFTRILMMFMANVLALTIASDNFFGIRVTEIVPYALVTIAIVVNEYIINAWRVERDAELAKLPVSPDEPNDRTAPQPGSKSGLRKKRPSRKPQTEAGE